MKSASIFLFHGYACDCYAGPRGELVASSLEGYSPSVQSPIFGD